VRRWGGWGARLWGVKGDAAAEEDAVLGVGADGVAVGGAGAVVGAGGAELGMGGAEELKGAGRGRRVVVDIGVVAGGWY